MDCTRPHVDVTGDQCDQRFLDLHRVDELDLQSFVAEETLSLGDHERAPAQVRIERDAHLAKGGRFRALRTRRVATENADCRLQIADADRASALGRHVQNLAQESRESGIGNRRLQIGRRPNLAICNLQSELLAHDIAVNFGA